MRFRPGKRCAPPRNVHRVITLRDAYLQAAASAAELLGRPAVADAWARPSALAEFRVSGLAGHLANQVLTVPAVLGNEVPDEPPIALLDHYAQSRWRSGSVDDEINVGIREQGERHAADGAGALAERVAATVAELAAVLPDEPADRVVFLPWGPWSLALEDFLVTRMMEIAVHSDDLAVSVGTETPDLADAVLEPVLALLTALAVERHGQPAVLRALTRAERAPARINAI
jgi:Mycothiol maleylpyruvate isomerase N-terminal domain